MKTAEELHSFVQKRLRRGYPQGELMNDLLQEGYTKEEIDAAIYAASPVNTIKPGTSNNPLWFVLTTGLGITGLSLVTVPWFISFRTIGYTLIAIGAVGIFIKFLLPFIDKK